MPKTSGLTITTAKTIPVPMFFTLAPEDKRERTAAATPGVTVCEVSQVGEREA
jgi:hypothetical protein